MSLSLKVQASTYWDEYKETVLNGADPILSDNLIPIMISDDGTVTKANISEKWYSYDDKIWANAVILKDEAVTYADGETIPESNIESYFVWIPKYSYQLWDLGNYTDVTSIDTTKPHEIPIRFGLTSTSDSVTGECTTPSTAESTGNCSVGEYMTHPAFLAFDSNGFWVGKFETGYDGATSTGAAEVNVVDTSKIIIKPNVYSWRGITVGTMFKNSYDYKRELDSHMMKNTEWGAVAYLQHSKYGSGTSVRVNNNSACITGYSGTSEPTIGFNNFESISGNRNESTDLGRDGTYTKRYNTSTGYLASTTGNISGIYDMSAGSHEYVMGYTTKADTTGGSSEITSLYNNFFNNSTYTKYWDRYTSTELTNFSNRILGDATGEMGPFEENFSSWYNDLTTAALTSSPWFCRGGSWYDGVNSGIFDAVSDTGEVRWDISYRIVLTPQ